MTEKEWMSLVVDLARVHGWLVYHTFDARRSQPGFPDLVMVRDRVLFVELKTDAGRISPAQLDWLERLRAASDGGARFGVHIWRPAELPAVQERLRR